ncbi:MAG TPA: hypothetical protein PL140_00030, partial [Ferrovaceae bacterium]|nr:hypothetical protein [Ferrovaceae bacterium]
MKNTMINPLSKIALSFFFLTISGIALAFSGGGHGGGHAGGGHASQAFQGRGGYYNRGGYYGR